MILQLNHNIVMGAIYYYYGEYKETCGTNHARNIEPLAMVEMFQRLMEVHEVKYDCHIGDGDSKAECVNHVQKRILTKRRNCKKNKKRHWRYG